MPRSATGCAPRPPRSAASLAEVRGLSNQTIRRLERLQLDLDAERRARIEDLALLVDLIASGWHGVERRLDRLERSIDRLERSLEDRPVGRARTGSKTASERQDRPSA